MGSLMIQGETVNHGGLTKLNLNLKSRFMIHNIYLETVLGPENFHVKIQPTQFRIFKQTPPLPFIRPKNQNGIGLFQIRDGHTRLFTFRSVIVRKLAIFFQLFKKAWFIRLKITLIEKKSFVQQENDRF